MVEAEGVSGPALTGFCTGLEYRDRRLMDFRGDALRVLVPWPLSTLVSSVPITELRQEIIRSEGVLWVDSLPIEDAMLWRAEFERPKIFFENVELPSQDSLRRF